MKKYNYKYLIGFITGILLCGGSVYAGIMYSSNIVSYDHSFSNLTSNNVQGAIDELAAKATLTTCQSDQLCVAKKSTLAPGDYIVYKPNKTSYTTDTTKTGYYTTETINPSELTMWRVLRINQDGTVDIISQNASSTDVSFRGITGYQNFVGYLNVLASQYENSEYTIGSRYFGYDNQTEYITSSAYFTNPRPWTCPTGGTCTPDPDDYEAYGGGDEGYLADYNLVLNALGTRTANKEGTSTPTIYWMASRYYYTDAATYYSWSGRDVVEGGYDSRNGMYYYQSNDFRPGNPGYALRPIVTLKSGLSYYGIGTKDYPMEIVSNN